MQTFEEIYFLHKIHWKKSGNEFFFNSSKKTKIKILLLLKFR